MSDSDIILNNLGLSDTSWSTAQDGPFGVETPPSAIVDILINGISISTITGPTPLMDLSRTYENDDGYLSTIIESVNLNGKIVPSSTGIGFVPIMNAISGLKTLISSCPVNTLEVTCNGAITYKATGMIVKNFAASKTENNWTRTADFSIDLEQKVDSSGNVKTVTDKVESWTIEPLEDAGYISFNQPLSGLNPEYLSPDMKPTAPSRNAPQPGTSVNGGQIGNGTSLGVNTRGQYRITRRLSARGLALASGTGICDNDQNKISAVKLNNARKWVEEQASGITGSGVIVIPSLGSAGTIGGGINLYNHNRSSSADIFNGTYEMTDNWIAMPTGTHHTESFTIDCSTSNNFTKTIRIAGTVNGMAMYNHSSHKALLTPSGSGLTLDLYIASGNVNKSGSLPAHSPSSLATGSPGGNGNSTSTTLHPNKYQNAKDAWEQEIKPYLYRRACLGMSQYGRVNRQATNEVDPTKPENPSFFTDRPLNSIPVSTTEGHDPIRGLINYNYEFNNQYRAIPGVISENINITHDAPADNISETTVLGRYLGPIIQSIGRTNARKTITIDIVVQPPQTTIGSIPGTAVCPIGLNTDLRTYVQNFVDGHAPFYPRDASVFGTSGTRAAQTGTVFVQSDQETWSPTEGRFSKTVSWIYQQCSVGKHWLNY